MKILSIDTATNICGVSILENKKLICSLDTNTGRTHSENLMPMINEAFKKTKLSINDISLIVCDIGPGSFTGIRIGVATAKAFHDSLSIPIIGVSSLESFAYSEKENISDGDYIFSIIDCKNDNCYYALYEYKNNCLHDIIAPKADNIDNLKDISIKYYDKKIIFVGDGVNIYKDKLKVLFPNSNFSNNFLLNSYNLGLCGLNKFNSNNFNDVLPLYLKKPQAQKQLEEKMLKNFNV